MDATNESEGGSSPPSAAEELARHSADTTNREATELTTYNSAATNASASTKSLYPGHFGPIKKFWRRHVSLRVPHVKCRDHLANERTFLAWIRTSIALSMLGAVIAQLFRLQNSPSPPGVISLYVMAVPLACICQGAALVTALAGSHRYWRQQSAMARGQALASGWEFWLMIGLSGCFSFSLSSFWRSPEYNDGHDKGRIGSTRPCTQARQADSDIGAIHSLVNSVTVTATFSSWAFAAATEDQKAQSRSPPLELEVFEPHQERTWLTGRPVNRSRIIGPLKFVYSYTAILLGRSRVGQTYSAAASFVPKLTQKVLEYLDPQPEDRILDVGCGDGKFTANFASSVAEVYGVDASASFVASATEDYGNSKTHFKVVDCRYLERDLDAVQGKWDKVVSNAALHWILRSPDTRHATLRAIFLALKPKGRFVFEMGGAGNVAEIQSALFFALMRHGQMSISAAHAANPWFFPSEKWMHVALEDIGFKVEKLELEYRPTRLTEDKEKGGLEGWVRLMGASMLEAIEDATKRESAVKEVCEVLGPIVTREEDTSQWLGYVRLRGVASRPE